MPSRAAPPPLKKPRSPSGAPAPQPVDPDSAPGEDDPLAGEWLFKQGDVVLGPVSAKLLMERIDKGELSPDTPVGREAGRWRPLTSIAAFKDVYEAREERVRREAEERAWQARVRRARVLRFSTLLVLVLLPFAAGAVAGRQVMIERPWDDTEEWMQRAPPLVDLPKKEEPPPPPPPVAAAPTPSPDPPGDDGARAGLEDPGGKEGDARLASNDDRRSSASRRREDRRDRDDKKDDRKDDKKLASAAAAKDDEPRQSGPLPETLTNEQAVAPLKSISGALKSCFIEELQSNPDVPSQVTLSYTVTENGTATNVRFEERELRGRPVVACVKKAMSTARWPKFTGERKNVSVPFKLGKPKASK